MNEEIPSRASHRLSIIFIYSRNLYFQLVIIIAYFSHGILCRHHQHRGNISKLMKELYSNDSFVWLVRGYSNQSLSSNAGSTVLAFAFSIDQHHTPVLPKTVLLPKSVILAATPSLMGLSVKFEEFNLKLN